MPDCCGVPLDQLFDCLIARSVRQRFQQWKQRSWEEMPVGRAQLQMNQHPCSRLKFPVECHRRIARTQSPQFGREMFEVSVFGHWIPDYECRVAANRSLPFYASSISGASALVGA